MQSDASPLRESYLKFDLTPFAGQTVSLAVLRMFVIDGTGGSQNIKTVENTTWTENSITFANRPPKGATITTFLPGPTTGVWSEVNITSAAAAAAGSFMSLAIDSLDSNGYDFNSAEAPSDRVQLVISGPSSPTPTTVQTPTATLPPGAVVMVGAGDIANCGSTGDEQTASLLDSIPGTVFTLGDNAYDIGSAQQFTDCYEPSWGRHKARTKPAVGNHEYGTAGAAGHYGYFGAAGSPLDQPCLSGCNGYYSYDLGDWHIIVLNSECSVPGDSCVVSAMEQWLRDDLAANPTACTLAYWHKPVLTIGPHANDEGGMLPFWRILYDGGAELVLAGHEHSYQRYGTLNREANGSDVGGIRQIVAGTGGRGLTVATRTEFTPGLQAWQDATTANAWGVLKLALYPGGYGWEFVPVAGKTFTDSGSHSCHAAPSTSTPSPAPTPSSTPSLSPTPTHLPRPHPRLQPRPRLHRHLPPLQRRHLLPFQHRPPRQRRRPRLPPASRFKQPQPRSTPLSQRPS